MSSPMSLLKTAADASPSRRAPIEAEMLSAMPSPQSPAPAGTAPWGTKARWEIQTRSTQGRHIIERDEPERRQSYGGIQMQVQHIGRERANTQKGTLLLSTPCRAPSVDFEKEQEETFETAHPRTHVRLVL